MSKSAEKARICTIWVAKGVLPKVLRNQSRPWKGMHAIVPQPTHFLARICHFRATLDLIVEFDLKFLPVPVTAYSQTS
jgi:hypothetical protein